MKVCCINSVVVKGAERPEEDADLPGCDLQNKKYVKRKKHLHWCAENKNNSSEFGRFLLTLTKLLGRNPWHEKSLRKQVSLPASPHYFEYVQKIGKNI